MTAPHKMMKLFSIGRLMLTVMVTLTSWSTWMASMNMRRRWRRWRHIWELIIIVLKVKQWRDEGEIQNECDGPCYKVMLKVKDRRFGDTRTVTTTYEGNLKPNHLKPCMAPSLQTLAILNHVKFINKSGVESRTEANPVMPSLATAVDTVSTAGSNRGQSNGYWQRRQLVQQTPKEVKIANRNMWLIMMTKYIKKVVLWQKEILQRARTSLFTTGGVWLGRHAPGWAKNPTFRLFSISSKLPSL